MPYPSSPQAISLEIGLQLQKADPELFQIISGGDIPATLELAVMDGSLPDVAATPQERQEQANAAQVQAILDRNGGNPYGADGYYLNPSDPNPTYVPKREMHATDAFTLEALDPALAAKLKAEAAPAATGGMSAEDVAFVRAEMARSRMESLELANYSLQEIY